MRGHTQRSRWLIRGDHHDALILCWHNALRTRLSGLELRSPVPKTFQSVAREMRLGIPGVLVLRAVLMGAPARER